MAQNSFSTQAFEFQLRVWRVLLFLKKYYYYNYNYLLVPLEQKLQGVVVEIYSYEMGHPFKNVIRH